MSMLNIDILLLSEDELWFERVLGTKNPSRVLLATANDSSDRGCSEVDHDLGFAVVKAGTMIQIKSLDAPNQQATYLRIPVEDGRFWTRAFYMKTAAFE